MTRQQKKNYAKAYAQELMESYNQIDGFLLGGSVARGNDLPISDIDIWCFLKEGSAQEEAQVGTKGKLEDQIARHEAHLPKGIPSEELQAFREHLRQALSDPETKKVAIQGLIRRIVVYPDATLEIEFAVQTPVSKPGCNLSSATGNRTPV